MSRKHDIDRNVNVFQPANFSVTQASDVHSKPKSSSLRLYTAWSRRKTHRTQRTLKSVVLFVRQKDKTQKPGSCWVENQQHTDQAPSCRILDNIKLATRNEQYLLQCSGRTVAGGRRTSGV